jgi:hypothetical protein
MATTAICLIKQLAVTLFFGYVFGYHFFFQGLEFGYCVFLLSRQCGKSEHFKTLKLMWQTKTFQNSETERECLSKIQKHYLGS